MPDRNEYSEIKITKDFTLILHSEQQKVLDEMFGKREPIHDSNEDIFKVDLDKWIIKRKREDNKEEKLPRKLKRGW